MRGAGARALAFIFVAQTLFMPAWGGSPDLEQRIERIQNGLLPPVLVKGEPAQTTTLASRMDALHVPAVSLAVIHDGKIEWARGFGVMRIGGPPVTAETLFQAASISKPVSALAAMHLVQAGKLSLDADINVSLKSWQVPDNEFTKQSKVTLRGLLTHSAGVTVHGFAGYEAGAPLPTLLQILNGEAPANSPPIRVDMLPGKIWRYSGGGYLIAQQAMEDVTATPFPKLMQNLVLRPFGMTHSTYEQPLPAQRRAQVALPYLADGTPVQGGPHVYPELAAAALWTTPSDLASFALGVGRTLAGKANRVLSAENARGMLVPAFNQQSIGFVVGGRTERKWFNHGGANFGYRCLMYVYQDGRDGAVVMTNDDNGDRLHNEIMRTIAYEYGWPDYSPPERVLNAVDPQTFDRYAGAYQFPNGSIFTFWRDGAQIRTRIWGQGAVDLFPTSEQEYFAKVVDARLTFAGETAILFQNDIAQTMKRMDPADGLAQLDWSIATDKRFKEQTPAPQSEAALRRLIAGLASGTPSYDEMVPALAQLTRQYLPTLHDSVLRFGPVQTIAFKRVLPTGMDIYEVKFDAATRDFGILLQADGRTFAAQFTP